MNILRYDENCSPEDIQKIYVELTRFFPNGELIAIPKDYDLLLDCSSFDLYNLRDAINNAIREKEILNEM